MKIHEQYNRAIWQLWLKTYRTVPKGWLNRIPMFYPEFKGKECGKNPYVLFVGSNPSYDERYLKKIRKTLNERTSLAKIFKYSENREKQWIEVAEKAIPMQADALQGHRYYTAIRKFSNTDESLHCGKNYSWDATDILAIRCTKEQKVKNILTPDFELKQLSLWRKLVRRLDPDLIVVTSAYARDILQSRTQGSKKIFLVNGHPYQQLFNRYPTLFMGMLSGQRSLDIGSRELWKWYIPRFLKLSQKK
jgi:hypothetical protein